MTCLRVITCLALAVFLVACTDGATRIANDIEDGVSRLESSHLDHYTVRHLPKAEPEGCDGPYDVQFVEHSALVIWCKDAGGARTTSSHITTYHLNFVDVPKGYMLHKAAGEPLWIDLARQDGRIVVSDVR